MPNNKWTDDSIEDLLKGFPAIKDNRPKEKVYNQLVQKEPVHKRPNRWLPLLVAALAFIAVGLLVSSIINQNGIDSAQNRDSSNNGAEMKTQESIEEQESLPAAEESRNESADSYSTAQVEETLRTAVYEESIGDQTLMTIGMTENAFVIPVSFLIPNEEITKTFENTLPSSLELYQKYADKLDEVALGFDDYHPYVGTLEKTATGIRHSLPGNHQYDLASASINVYMNTMTETFADVEEISVTNEEGSPIEFSQIGPVEKLVPGAKNLAYYSYQTNNGEIYLAPGYNMPFNSAKQAITALADAPNDVYEATIPQNLEYQVLETEKIVEVDFKNNVDLESMDRLDIVRMLESLVLTANTFDKEVVVKGFQQEIWNGFDFTKPMPIPLAPNLLEWSIQ
ncbi:hypothetical protein Plano_1810 [Planococcus sp. PAMC 21323]|uniref:GerMN domain-containing protein n=1 Tax=Planococcus sp. PAMC 21323 TaxID=1526927 RepID=UPI000571FF3E|nr:GerMN domain-containing protein [Planococcus sp. PAMC 21323]AIY05775.1 hypothetical protein Plano_1810 [Planococcus sp. PAMC 21323]